MSIKNLEFTGLKDQNVICNNLEVKGNTTADNGITVSSGNVNIAAGEILVNSASQVGSVGPISYTSGLHFWSSGQAPGDNPLNLSLDINSHLGYIVRIFIVLESTNISNHIRYTCNNDSNAEYCWRVQNNGAPNDTGVSETSGVVYKIDSGTTCNCGIEFEIVKNQFGLNSYPMTGFYMAHEPSSLPTVAPTGGRVWSIYQNSSGANLTSMQIDVSDANHTGCSLLYLVHRYT